MHKDEEKQSVEEEVSNPMKENPIDLEKIAQNPSLLPYSHTVGGAVIKPIDKGKVKGKAMMAMREQTDTQMEQIREQIELLAKQAKALKRRIEISEKIYMAELNFEPVYNKNYHLYEKKNGKWQLSMVAPEEWGRTIPFQAHLATVRLMADSTWELQDREDLETDPPEFRYEE
ncbi:MAG: DUF2452 domain-containing protein [Bacteroidota bacterium]